LGVLTKRLRTHETKIPSIPEKTHGDVRSSRLVIHVLSDHFDAFNETFEPFDASSTRPKNI